MGLRNNPALTDFSPQQEIDPTDGTLHLITVAQYRNGVTATAYTDFDGYGHPVAKVGERYSEDPRHEIIPSMWGADIPAEATHINWFNS